MTQTIENLTIAAIRAQCEVLREALVSRGFTDNSYVDFKLSSDAFDCRVTATAYDETYHSHRFEADMDEVPNVMAAFAKVKALIREAPSQNEIKRKKLAEDTAKILERARELGNDAGAQAFVAQLEAAMQALSENAIEHHKTAAE